MVEATKAGRLAWRGSAALCLGLFLTVGSGWGISQAEADSNDSATASSARSSSKAERGPKPAARNPVSKAARGDSAVGPNPFNGRGRSPVRLPARPESTPPQRDKPSVPTEFNATAAALSLPPQVETAHPPLTEAANTAAAAVSSAAAEPPSVTALAPAAAVPTAAVPPEPSTPAAAQALTATGGWARDAGAPLQSTMLWTMLAGTRSDSGRRYSGAAFTPQAAATTSLTVGPADATALQPAGQSVSPLGTPEQTAAEDAAMRTARSLPMLVMKGVLNLGWRIIGANQFAMVGGPDQANLDALGQAVDEWAMATAFQLMILNSNEPTIVTQVAPPHDWYGLDVTGSRILYDNPDTIYRFVGVNYASEYVITGRLPENDPQASFSVLTGTTGTTAAVLNGDQLELGPDRTFVITVSGEAAQPGQSNHLQITPDTTLIAIRDTLADWSTEDPMTLAIHRTAGPPNSLFSQLGGFAIPVIGAAVAQSPLLTALVSLIPPLPSVPPILRGTLGTLLMLRGFSQEAIYIKVATTDPDTGQLKAPNVFTDPIGNASFLATQLQSAGYFQLADDQALVLTINPNNAAYFGVPVTNDWTITDNYWDEQTSLNIAQARSNPDGSYTIVVSPTEPVFDDDSSVWNWVSTNGLNQGTISIRFQAIDTNLPDNPTVSSQVVTLSDLASVLPAGTTFVTPAERAAQLATRKEGFNRRFAPYPQTA
ncbi:MAG: DUF1214 domain-containing protein [Mycobacterium sp.]|nr:DUF1214 domain-containing protein [Mycobacterium sp.]